MAYTKLKLGREKGVRHAALGFCRGRAAQPAFSPFSYVQQQKKTILGMIFSAWRRERDSNP